MALLRMNALLHGEEDAILLAVMPETGDGPDQEKANELAAKLVEGEVEYVDEADLEKAYLAMVRIYMLVVMDPETGRPYSDPDEGPSAADTCELLYAELARLGMKVP